MIRVASVHFVHYRRIPESRRWTFRCLVIATHQIHLLDLVQQELTVFPEAIEAKISNQCWRKSGMFVATFFFHTMMDAMAFRERNYQNEYCVIAGPIRKPANRSGDGQETVRGARPENDGLPQVDAGQAAHFRQLVAQEQDMALYLDGLAFA
jgi:hypothetical protein